MKRNYVVINGVKSDTIKGLLIQELPPVSKPLMRTQIDTVDGRDGDIITNLGYQSYEKNMEIGLFGDYDIDDVIRFFSSKGTVTFSNEPDKYYNFQIIKQIDFQRLLRFKTAIVTFYVQPYKYDAVDKIYTFTNNGDSNWFNLTNRGNTESKPIITLYGRGIINLYLNDGQIFIINLGDAEYIIIDVVELKAYHGNTLMNRSVSGDYSDLELQTGINKIGWTGYVSKVIVENYSRWI